MNYFIFAELKYMCILQVNVFQTTVKSKYYFLRFLLFIKQIFIFPFIPFRGKVIEDLCMPIDRRSVRKLSPTISYPQTCSVLLLLLFFIIFFFCSLLRVLVATVDGLLNNRQQVFGW